MRTLASIEPFAEAKKRAATTAPSKKPAATKSTKPKHTSDDDDEDFQPKRARGKGPNKQPVKKRNRLICKFHVLYIYS